MPIWRIAESGMSLGMVSRCALGICGANWENCEGNLILRLLEMSLFGWCMRMLVRLSRCSMESGDWLGRFVLGENLTIPESTSGLGTNHLLGTVPRYETLQNAWEITANLPYESIPGSATILRATSF